MAVDPRIHSTQNLRRWDYGPRPASLQQVANAGYITENQPITLSGDVTGTGTTAITVELVDTGVTPGAYTNSNITVDVDGRITAASNGTSTNQTITLSGDLTGSGTTAINAQIAAGAVGTAEIANSNVTYAKIQNVAANRILGNATGTAAVVSEIVLPLAVANGGTGGTTAALARAGIGAVNIAGDNMTGALSVSGRITTTGATGAVQITEQGGANSFTWISSADTLFCNHSGAANILSLTGGGALQVNSTLTASGGIVGSSTNDAAAAGMVGQYIASQVLFASRTSISSATATNVTTISLTAGDWQVGGSAFFVPTATATTCEVSISTTSATAADPSLKAPSGPSGGAGFGIGNVAPSYRLSLASTTTVYLVASISLASGTCQVCGIVWARRMR